VASWSDLRELVEEVLSEASTAGESVVEGPDAASAAFFLALAARYRRATVVAVAPSPAAAVRLRDDLEYFLGGRGAASLIPPYESIPFEEDPPDPSATGQRLASLHGLATGRPGIYVATPAILTERLIPPAVLREAAREFRTGTVLDLQEAARHLESYGYLREGLVENPGEYSVRGHILDVFSPGWEWPLRIELFDDYVEEMKWFNPEGQRSLQPVDRAVLLPAMEIVGDATLPTFLRRTAREYPDSPPLTDVRRALRDGGVRPWHVSLLPLFYQEPATILDYGGGPPLLALVGRPEVLQGARARVEEVRRFGVEAGHTTSFVERFLDEGARVLSLLEGKGVPGRATLSLYPTAGYQGSGRIHRLASRPTALRFTGKVTARREGEWAPVEELRNWGADAPVVVVARTAGSARRLREILRDHDLGARLVEEGPFDLSWFAGGDLALTIHVGELRDGFRLPDHGVTVVSEDDLFGAKHRLRERRHARANLFELDFSTLEQGDFLVHEEHGIGRFAGISRVKVDNHHQEMLSVRYADEGVLYLPMDKLQEVQKFVSAEGHVPKVDSLGGKSWERAKSRARKAVRTMVRELLKTQARRQSGGGFAFSPDTSWQNEFEALFEYEETPDQWRAIEDVKRDMESPRPMDRLVCGDVGYGKTEVAMRAVFKAVQDGKQAVVLVPTTVLCHQHHLTFGRRFAPFPVRIASLSRFISSREARGVLKELAAGSLDVVIGTHRLLQKDVRFHDLGLVVVDEEHRFGVRDKEKLKKLRETADVLTLSATPIPRTFYMSLSGLRDLSVIETPPESRLGIRTKVAAFGDRIIREAVGRELARGGQVFFLHNRIKSIFGLARHVASLCPEVRIAVGHGRMPEGKLKEVMVGFMNREYDVLVSTSIVESGLDIPNANTMLINRADRFGLADLYQLRGRIGRSSRQAYCYLLVPAGALKGDALRRLQAIEEHSELGAGVKIAAMDLEIRGAGNLLGYQQSGRLAEVGLEMYSRLLEEEVAEVRGEAAGAAVVRHAEVSVPWPARLPEEYIADQRQRLTIYKRLSQVEREGDLGRLGEEMADLFGHPPAEVVLLLGVTALRLAAQRAGVERVRLASGQAEITFHRATPVEPSRVVELIARGGGSIRLKGAEQMVAALPPEEPAVALERVRDLLDTLAGAALPEGGGR
jgi:transcription-repair coupling factor (superfamily II helicase)